MDKKQKSILIGIILLIVGGLIGYTIALRSVGQGPLQGLSSMSSSANLQDGGSTIRGCKFWYINHWEFGWTNGGTCHGDQGHTSDHYWNIPNGGGGAVVDPNAVPSTQQIDN